MNSSRKYISPTVVIIFALLVAPLAQATNGYFKIGYGSKNRGMAGTGIAYGQDSLASAINPAALVGMGDRIDAGLEIFNPKRKGTVDARGLAVTNPPFGFAATDLQGAKSSKNSGAEEFVIPSIGFTNDWGEHWQTGLAFVANGGLNTRYSNNLYTDAFTPVIGQASNNSFPSPPLPPGPSGFAGLLEFGFGVDPNQIDAAMGQLFNNKNLGPSLGVNLAQLLITPTVAYSFNDQHSIGFSPIIARQSFRAYGLGLFQAFSSDPSNVTNKGNDYSWGYGGRVGYLGKFRNFSVGASYTSKIYMQEFDDYAGLFAEDGDFDIPSTFGIGVAFRVTPKLTIAADVSRINYSDVKSMSNDGPTANEFLSAFATVLSNGTAPGQSISNPLGTNNGWGFGWDDATVFKIGANYAYDRNWEFRVGYNYSEVPYDDDQALFNVLAPAVVEHHATLGFTYTKDKHSQWTVTYMHAFYNDVDFDYKGTDGFSGFSYAAENEMEQNSIEVSYGYAF
jgi:long-chain fatty acid transport protein